MDYKISEIDHQRFGVVTAKAFLLGVNDVPLLMQRVLSDEIKFLIIRLSTDDLEIAQQLEKMGAFITDTLVYYVKKCLDLVEADLPEGYSARYANLEDSNNLERLALQTFDGYLGHYHSDPNLKKEDCDQVYSSWAVNSCKHSYVADKVILIEKYNELVAFATLKLNSDEEVEGVLFGVSPAHRRRGLHFCLMKLAQNWCVENQYKQLVTSTQINNIHVQKNWTRLGFELSYSYYTFHKWFK